MIKKRVAFTVVIGVMAILILLPVGCASSQPTSPAPTTLQPSPARDLTGTWTGSGVYYQLNLSGDRVLKVTAEVVMTLQQTDDTVIGTLEVYPTKQEPTGQGNWVPELEGSTTVNGNVTITTLTFYVGTKVAGVKEEWEFTFTSDLMSGHVTNLDTAYYLGRDSDSNAFKLVRSGSQVSGQPPSTPTPTPTPSPEPTLPPGTPAKPISLLASDAEYYLIYTTFENWGFDFNTLYEKYSNEGIINNWAWFWIGSEEDENKRIYFDRVGDQWKPRTIPVPLTSTPPKPPSTVQIWEIVDEAGHTAILTVDSNGNFTGSGWVGKTPSGSYDIPITNGIMSGTSMSFHTSASYDGGQGTISGIGSGRLNEPFPFATSASGVWSGTISDPLGTRNFSVKWTATKVSD